jgi:hypothetical protein
LVWQERKKGKAENELKLPKKDEHMGSCNKQKTSICNMGSGCFGETKTKKI